MCRTLWPPAPGFADVGAVRAIVEAGPAAIREIISLGAKFTTRGELGHTDGSDEYDLGREGGHHKRRILHAGDITGAELERTVVEAVRATPNIEVFEYHVAIDLIVSSRLDIGGPNRCFGAYVLDAETGHIATFLAPSTTIACGGAGKVYLYTSNPDVACGSGVAMAYRAGAKIANMEFIQFHPTILHHPTIRSFLISEALRGEGAVLKCRDARGAEPGGIHAEISSDEVPCAPRRGRPGDRLGDEAHRRGVRLSGHPPPRRGDAAPPLPEYL